MRIKYYFLVGLVFRGVGTLSINVSFVAILGLL